jgi:rubredoxin
MDKYVCDVCGYIYDEGEGCQEQDVAPNTKWEDVFPYFVCPICGAGKDSFSKM